MTKHSHSWHKLVPRSADILGDKIAYFVEIMGDSVLKRTYICTGCGKTGHAINSQKGGIRVHQNDYFKNKAKELSGKYNFKIPGTN